MTIYTFVVRVCMTFICAIDPHGTAWTTSGVTTCSDCILQCHCKHLMFLCVCPIDIALYILKVHLDILRKVIGIRVRDFLPILTTQPLSSRRGMQTASDKSLDTMIIIQLAILPVPSVTYPLVALPSSLDLITPSLPAIVCTTALLTHGQMGLILIFTLAQTAKDQTNR